MGDGSHAETCIKIEDSHHHDPENKQSNQADVEHSKCGSKSAKVS